MHQTWLPGTGEQTHIYPFAERGCSSMAAVTVVACRSVCMFGESVNSVRVRIPHIVTVRRNGKCTAFKYRQPGLVLILVLALSLMV